ncbi:MAG: hypothetical protein ACREN7_08155 [Candidatus Dormibacteria bacterium]
MDIDELADLADGLPGVSRTRRDGRWQWRYHGRLVARQLDDLRLVIRSDFNRRDKIPQEHPGTSSVPSRFLAHMMVVANLPEADTGAVEDAVVAAWTLQRNAD